MNGSVANREIDPKRAFRVLFCHSCFESLGLEYLSAYLRAHGVDTSLVFDPRMFDDPFVEIPFLARRFDRRRSVVEEVIRRRPDLVAFSVVAADYRWALDTARGIKKSLPVPIVFGGIHATAAPRAVLENPEVDYCVVGEGEAALLDLVSVVRDGRDPSGVANLSFREGDGIRANPPRPALEDLDALPFPDKDLFYREIPGFSRHYTLLTRRGCTYECSYCHNTLWRRVYAGRTLGIRLRSVDSVLDELTDAMFRYRFDRVRINDDLFSHDEGWLLEFCRRYRREVARPFLCSCSPSHLSERSVSELQGAGCFQVCVGVQDVRDSVRREAFNRHTPQGKVVEALATLRRHRLRATVDNIVGHGSDTEGDLKAIASFYLENPVYGRFAVFWLIHFAGTEITRRSLEAGCLTAEEVRELERDPPRRANTRRSEEGMSGPVRRLHLFLIVMQWLPASVARWMFVHEAYRFLPAVNPEVVEGLWTLVTKDRLDPVRIRYWTKYWQYGRLHLRDLVRRRLNRNG